MHDEAVAVSQLICKMLMLCGAMLRYYLIFDLFRLKLSADCLPDHLALPKNNVFDHHLAAALLNTLWKLRTLVKPISLAHAHKLRRHSRAVVD